MERYKKGAKSNNPEPEFKFNAPVFKKKSILKGLQSISELGSEHPARKIVDKRKVADDRKTIQKRIVPLDKD